MDTRQYIRASLAWTPSPGKLEVQYDHLIIVGEDGTIAHSQPYLGRESQKALKGKQDDVVFLSPFHGFLFPAFVDLHLHAPQLLYAGSGLGLPLMQWLDKHAFQAERRVDEDTMLAKQVYKLLCQQLIDNGIGTTLLFGTIASESNCELGRCFQQAGLRGFVGKVSMDLNAPSDYIESSAKESWEAARRFCLHDFPAFTDTKIKYSQDDHKHQLVWPVITPRFIPTCSDELLKELGKLVKERPELIVQSHMCESADEVAWVQSMRKGRLDSAIFDEAGLLGPSTVMHHCTSLTAEERTLMIQRGSSVASCPISNAYFSDRPFAMRESIDEGLKVGLGSDIAGGYTLDMMQIMRSTVLVSKLRTQADRLSDPASTSKDITWQESLYLATRGGASALTPPLHNLHGTFEIGAPFDAQFIQVLQDDGSGLGGISYFTPSWQMPEAVEKWWTLGDVRNRKGLWVAGSKLA